MEQAVLEMGEIWPKKKKNENWNAMVAVILLPLPTENRTAFLRGATKPQRLPFSSSDDIRSPDSLRILKTRLWKVRLYLVLHQAVTQQIIPLEALFWAILN